MIKCKDGEILDFRTNRICEKGHPTCSYGLAYIEDCEIIFSGMILKCRVINDNEYFLPQDFWTKLMCSNAQVFANMSECGVIELIKDQVKKCIWNQHNVIFEIIDLKEAPKNKDMNEEAFVKAMQIIWDYCFDEDGSICACDVGEAIKFMYELIAYHFDNPPLKKEDLHEDMWIWDNINKRYGKVTKKEEWEENRYYLREVKE